MTIISRNIFTQIFIVIVLASAGYSQNPTGRAEDFTGGRLSYVIARNEIDPEFKSRRMIDILIPKERFTIEGITALVDLLSKRFSSPKAIYFDIYTDIKDVPTLEDWERGGISGSRNETKFKGDYAVVVRLSKGEFGNRFMYVAD